MLVVKNPNGIPRQIALKNSLENNSIVELAMAKYAPKVRRGPKARKTAISPRPLLEASLIGRAV